MEWIVTTARSVDEAQTRALDLLGVDLDDAEIQVVEEGKTGLFGRTKSEARVRARIKPKAPPVKEERRQGRNDGRNRNNNRNRGGKGGNGGGGGRNQGGGNNRNRGGKGGGNQGGGNNRNQGGNSGGGETAAAAAGGAKSDGGRNGGNQGGGGGRNQGGNNGGGRNRNRGGGNRGGNGGGGRRDSVAAEDRVEMPVEEQRETLEAFVSGVAAVFDSSAKVTLVEEGTTLLAQVEGDDLGRLIGNKASTLQTLEELARTAMHRAAAGRRYHRIQVDVDSYRARRREALARFATDIAESVAASGKSKAMEPMGAADRKLIHDAVSEVAGVETVSEGRDPRRYIVILPLGGASDEEE